MFRKTILCLLLMALLLVGIGAAAAQEEPPIIPGVFTNPEWLRIDYQRVSVSIDNQIATTLVDMQFTNEGDGLAEGTFLFPLPEEAAVDQLTMYINGEPIQARILPADQARGIYDEIVRQYRDPALLEFIGTSAIQANVFPIPPGESRRIEIAYTQLLPADNGLIHYLFPIHTIGTQRIIRQMSVSVTVSGQDPVGNIYSPSHQIALMREGDTGFRAGFERANYVPDADFSLFYSIASDVINVNLLTYRESATEDGFFMLLVQPPLSIPENQIMPKDVIIVLDQSGSMAGEKWEQARAAAAYVLDNLNSADRFNAVLFSTGWRVYSTSMTPADQAQGAIDWINNQEAEGGTDINGALTTALGLADAERPTTIIFLTDGLATEGETESAAILQNLGAAAKPNVRIFTFGVGNDVDTLLLDAIVRDHRGASSYVREGERIDEEVASLYNKISAPVLTDISLDFGGVTAELLYPAQLPDLFAGTQLTIVGRFRGSVDNTSITLRGTVNGEAQTFVYSNLSFPANAGGEAFIARLWATRRIGDLLNTIRLNGESPELVNSIIDLSIRYGIITPYTSFLIEEDDILSVEGRAQAEAELDEQAGDMASRSSGEAAVADAEAVGGAAAAEAPAPAAGANTSGENVMQVIGSKTFILREGVWIDTTFQPDTMPTQPLVFLSDEYFELVTLYPELGDYFAIGERVIVVYQGVAYEVVSQ